MRVYGGATNAGWKRQQPQRKDWVCPKGHEQRYYAVNCLQCGEKRPKNEQS